MMRVIGLLVAVLVGLASPAFADTYMGDFPVNALVDCKWNTNDQTGASITRSTDGTLKIYKNNSATERTSLAGVTQSEDFDAATGVHHIRIDTSDNTDAGFYAAGNEYFATMTAMTIDTKTVSAQVCSFSIERANGILALIKARLPNATPGAAGGLFIAGTNAATTFATLTVTGATTLTGNLVLSDGLTVSAPSTGNRAGVTITGNGTGAGIDVTSGNGATGNAVKLTAASTNGDGLSAAGAGSGVGTRMTGGATGSGALIAGGASGAHGLTITTTSSGSGIRIASVSHAIDLAPTSGDGIKALGGTNGHGISATGAGSGGGFTVVAGATGKGIAVSTTAGDALSLLPTAGHAIVATANGTSKHGAVITGGTAGTSDGFKAVAGTGGVDARFNITGSLSGSVGSVAATSGGVTVMSTDALVKGSTSVIYEIIIRDATTGAGMTGLTNASAGLSIRFCRADQGNAACTSVSPAAATRGSFTSAGFVEKDATNAPGVYEYGITNASIATGADLVTFYFQGVSGMIPTYLPIALVDTGLAALNTKIGTPAGASVSADIAAVNVLDTAIKAKTDSLAFTGADLGVIVNNYASGKGPLQSTVAGRTLDVAADGGAGLDWANVKSPTTTVGLSGTTVGVVSSLTANGDKTGYALSAAQTFNVTGNLSGSVGSVTGAVGSVTGAVGSVTGAVGSVTGAVGSVTGAVGSVTGNVGGNVVGSVASVTGAVGSVTGAVASVTGAVGSVTGNVGGNVTGTIGSLAAQAKTDVAVAIGGRVGESVGSYTYDQMMRIMFSILAGRTNTNGTVFKTPDNSTGRATFTIDGSNNRTGSSLTP